MSNSTKPMPVQSTQSEIRKPRHHQAFMHRPPKHYSRHHGSPLRKEGRPHLQWRRLTSRQKLSLSRGARTKNFRPVPRTHARVKRFVARRQLVVWSSCNILGGALVLLSQKQRLSQYAAAAW